MKRITTLTLIVMTVGISSCKDYRKPTDLEIKQMDSEVINDSNKIITKKQNT